MVKVTEPNVKYYFISEVNYKFNRCFDKRT